MTEAEKIYRCIFGGRITPRLEEQFQAIPDTVFPPITDEMHEQYERILADVRDLEALEFASRTRQRNLLLTLKFQLMVHLAECQPECRPAYINRENRGLLQSLLLVGIHAIRCSYKALKGRLLLRYYDGP